MARRTSLARAERHGVGGFTLIELLMVVALICIIITMAVPMVLRARMAGNEASAIGTLRAINSAESAFAASAASGGYATQLAVLAMACPGGSVGFISPDLSSDPARRSGYVITLDPGTAAPGPDDCHGSASRAGYYLTAVPIAIGMSGHRAFATTHKFSLYFDPTGVPPSEADMEPAGAATPLQ
jgi:prepilin-type N-terminal cleavage/methylation domain-containing protein